MKKVDRGVILAGGTGSRLLPLTRGINKHLLPVNREPMIFNSVQQLAFAGIRKIMVVAGIDDIGSIANMLGDGSDHGRYNPKIEFTYRPQMYPNGTAKALSLAEDFSHGESMVCVLADTVGRKGIGEYINNFKKQSDGARTLVRKVDDPENYGIALFSNGRIVRIEERPWKEKIGNYAILGYFMFDNKVFDIANQINISERGEYEMTDVLNAYAKHSKLLFDVVSGDDFVDCGTFEGIERAQEWNKKEF